MRHISNDDRFPAPQTSNITMIDLLLMFTMGLLGSFGHCASMCGSLAVALAVDSRVDSGSLSDPPSEQKSWWFHGVMNLSRILSYGLGGAILGGVSAAVISGGQLVGIGSQLRSTMALMGGLLLIGSGLSQIFPGEWPLPSFGQTCRRSIDGATKQPWLLGLLWGFMPCGFLYTAQLKAIESGSILQGALILLAFGCGTAPVMIGIGVFAGYFSRERRSQLRQAGGWIAILVGIITLGRSGEMMSDGTGYGAIICLILALVARPISKLWPGILSYRRLLGVGAGILSIAHLLHVVGHDWDWTWGAWAFLLSGQQAGIWAGFGSLGLLLPAMFTSFDRAQAYLGSNWRRLHLLGIPALMLAIVHGILTGASYLGTVQITTERQGRSIVAMLILVVVLLIRWRWLWSILSLEKLYVPAPSETKP
jgi:uncharacterized protein